MRRRWLPALYDALFEIGLMRASVAELGNAIAAAEAERVLVKLEAMEGVALNLLDAVERRGRVVAH